MELSKTERLILANQHAILAKLDEQNADHHVRMKGVYENGYAVNYDDDFQSIYNEFGREKSSLVMDVLDMYDTMQRAWKAAGSPDEFEGKLAFPGFDGNNETEYMSYARFLVEDEGRWANLDVADFNSHSLSVPFHQRRLDVWNQNGISERYELTMDDIREILDAPRRAA